MLRSEVGGNLSLPSPAVITLGEYLDLTMILHPHLCSGVKAMLKVLNKLHVKRPVWCLAQDKHQRSMGCYFQYLGDIISHCICHTMWCLITVSPPCPCPADTIRQNKDEIQMFA